MHINTRVALGLFLIACLLPSRLAAQVSSCTGQPNGTACTDGNSCTTVDRCESGICIAPVHFAHPAGSPIAVNSYPFANRVADVNRDGKPDLVVLNYTSHTFTVLLGNGAGGFSQPQGSPVPTPGAEQTLVVADFNVDGNPDVAITSEGGGPGVITVHLGNGAGGFTPAADPFVFAGSMIALAAGDLNRDSRPDLVTAHEGLVWVLLGNGAGGFTTAPGSPVASGGLGTQDGLVGDFNLDGKLDVAVAHQASGSVSLLLGDGAGGIAMAPGSPVSTDTTFGLAAGDLNRDGKPDLVSAGQLNVSVLLGDGSGGFVATTVLTAPLINNGVGYFISASVADFSLDGKPDIAVLNYWTDEFSILIGNGAGGFVELTDPSFGGLNTPHFAPVADFNVDGRPDLAVANFEASTVSIFLNDTGAPDGTGCSDENACTTSDACQSGSCVAGPAVNCDDGNACNGVETCDPATSCVGGTPVVCAPSDQCHEAGVCNPGTGLCSYANQQDGTTCDDGNPATSPDTCQGGVCTGASACTSTHTPRTAGWWNAICRSGGHSGETIDDADAACVGQLSDTFAGITTRNQVCAALDGGHVATASQCAKAERDLMALALNICTQRVCCGDGIDSRCDSEGNSALALFANNNGGGADPHGTPSTVCASLNTADGLLDDPSRTNEECKQADCLAKEVNNGHALEFATLVVRKDGANVRLNWLSPVLSDGTAQPSSYRIYRRASRSTAPFVQIGSTMGTEYLDVLSGTGSWEYDVTVVLPTDNDD